MLSLTNSVVDGAEIFPDSGVPGLLLSLDDIFVVDSVVILLLVLSSMISKFLFHFSPCNSFSVFFFGTSVVDKVTWQCSKGCPDCNVDSSTCHLSLRRRKCRKRISSTSSGVDAVTHTSVPGRMVGQAVVICKELGAV